MYGHKHLTVATIRQISETITEPCGAFHLGTIRNAHMWPLVFQSNVSTAASDQSRLSMVFVILAWSSVLRPVWEMFSKNCSFLHKIREILCRTTQHVTKICLLLDWYGHITKRPYFQLLDQWPLLLKIAVEGHNKGVTALLQLVLSAQIYSFSPCICNFSVEVIFGLFFSEICLTLTLGDGRDQSLDISLAVCHWICMNLIYLRFPVYWMLQL